MKLYLNKGKHKKRRAIKYNFEGQQIYNIFVIQRVENHDTRCATRVAWECRCDCGKIFKTTTRNLVRGQKSCGCLSISNRFKKFLSSIDASVSYKFSQYRTTAKRRKLSWALTIAQFKELILSNCYYCGQPPMKQLTYCPTKQSTKIYWNGIDRLNNIKGYNLNNSVTCCHMCNRAKLTLSEKEYIAWINNLVIYRTNKND